MYPSIIHTLLIKVKCQFRLQSTKKSPSSQTRYILRFTNMHVLNRKDGFILRGFDLNLRRYLKKKHIFHNMGACTTYVPEDREHRLWWRHKGQQWKIPIRFSSSSAAADGVLHSKLFHLFLLERGALVLEVWKNGSFLGNLQFLIQ